MVPDEGPIEVAPDRKPPLPHLRNFPLCLRSYSIMKQGHVWQNRYILGKVHSDLAIVMALDCKPWLF